MFFSLQSCQFVPAAWKLWGFLREGFENPLDLASALVLMRISAFCRCVVTQLIAHTHFAEKSLAAAFCNIAVSLLQCLPEAPRLSRIFSVSWIFSLWVGACFMTARCCKA